ncbi:MAG: desulfoferrodoxin [Erysipelotrichaceae bacterium]|nr:desulfoferrodoxin [Erysipelotrichaceae bacterium]
MALKFYRCLTCGNFFLVLNDGGVTPQCCGEPMVEVPANTEENVALEKHIPAVEVNGRHVKVVVGDVIHPMEEVHYIEWILLETDQGWQIKHLQPGEEPIAEFELLEGETALSAYEYCNLHGLWKKEL